MPEQTDPYFMLKSAGHGDYERIRISGMSQHLPRKDGMIRLERIAPFLPALSLPGSEVVITSQFLEVLSKSEFTDWKTVPVFKHLIVLCDWNGNGEFVREYEYAEPEDVILWEQHNPMLAEALGDLYELDLPIGCVARRTKLVPPAYEERDLYCQTFIGGDLFHAQLPGGVIPMCSERFKLWINSYPEVTRWVSFMPTRLYFE